MKARLDSPAIYWIMLPAGKPTEDTIDALVGELLAYARLEPRAPAVERVAFDARAALARAVDEVPPRQGVVVALAGGAPLTVVTTRGCPTVNAFPGAPLV